MKALMILGSVVGFLVAAGFGLANGSTWPTILWRACAAALVAALLARWWSRIWFQGLREAIEQRRQARPARPADARPAAKA